MPRVLPRIVALCEPAPEATVFTRFIPARRPGEGHGVWARYWQHWASMTLEAIPPETVDLVPELARFAPPATVVDKPVYSPWLGSDLHARLRARGCATLLVSGGETDMCVLAAVLGAADLGYRTILVSDAVCSTSDEAHDAMLALLLGALRPARRDRADRGGPRPLAPAPPALSLGDSALLHHGLATRRMPPASPSRTRHPPAQRAAVRPAGAAQAAARGRAAAARAAGPGRNVSAGALLPERSCRVVTHAVWPPPRP